MRTLFLFLAVLGAVLLVAAGTAPAMAAGPAIAWQRLLGGSGTEQCLSAGLTADGGCVLVGYTTSSQSGDVAGTNRGGNDLWLVKLDSAGTVEGKRLIGGSGDEVGRSVEQTSDGGYILIGDTTSSTSWDVEGTNHGGTDVWVVKTDANGFIQKQLLLGGTGDDFGRCIRQTADGGYILIGDTFSPTLGDPPFAPVPTHGGSDVWVARLDPAGALLWFKPLGGIGTEHGNFVEPTADGGFIVVGDSRSATITESGITRENHDPTGTCSDIWVVKLGPGGVVQTHMLLGGTGDDFGRCIQQTTDGGYIIVGASHSSESGDVTGVNHGMDDIWVVRLGPTGAILQQRLLGGNNRDDGHSVLQTADGGYVVLGSSVSPSITEGGVTEHGNGREDYWVVKLGPGGLTQWHDLLGSGGPDAGCSVLQTPDGGYVLAGDATPSSDPDGDVLGPLHGTGFPYESDYWVVRLAPPPPTVTSITPASAYAGQTVSATVSGTGFGPGAQVRLVGTHGYFSAANESTNSAGTAITCTFALPSAATNGSYAVAVQNAGASTWVSRPDAFMVYPPAPTVTGISPSMGAGRTQVTVNISGTNFEADDRVFLRHTGSDATIGPAYMVAVTPAQIRCEISIPGDAPEGVYDVRVFDGSTGWRTYAVLPGAFHVIEELTVTGISPASADAGDTIAATVSGTGFGPGAQVQLIEGGNTIDATGEAPNGAGTQIACTVAVPSSATAGSYAVRVRNAGMSIWAFRAGAFTVTAPSSTVVAVPPSTALPTDTDGDELYDDVNGNGRFDFADVVLYFNQMTWIEVNEPLPAFDYNANGRIDFADVVWLFNHI